MDPMAAVTSAAPPGQLQAPQPHHTSSIPALVAPVAVARLPSNSSQQQSEELRRIALLLSAKASGPASTSNAAAAPGGPPSRAPWSRSATTARSILVDPSLRPLEAQRRPGRGATRAVQVFGALTPLDRLATDATTDAVMPSSGEQVNPTSAAAVSTKPTALATLLASLSARPAAAVPTQQQDAASAYRQWNCESIALYDQQLSSGRGGPEAPEGAPHGDRAASPPPAASLPPFFAAQPDVEAWDAAFLRAPTYALGVKPSVMNDTAALSLVQHPAPPRGGWAEPTEKEADELNRPLSLQKTPKEHRRERHVQRVAATEKAQQEAAADGSKGAPRLTAKHLVTSVNEFTKSFLQPTELAVQIYKQVAARNAAHEALNRERHEAAAPHQVEHRTAKLQAEAEEFCRLAVFRVLPIRDTHKLQRWKITAKEWYLKGVIAHIDERFAVAIFAGGAEPMRKMVHFVRHRLLRDPLSSQKDRDTAEEAAPVRVLWDDPPPAGDGGAAAERDSTPRGEPLVTRELIWAGCISRRACEDAIFPDMSWGTHKLASAAASATDVAVDDHNNGANPPSGAGGGGAVRVLGFPSMAKARQYYAAHNAAWLWDAAVLAPLARAGDRGQVGRGEPLQEAQRPWDIRVAVPCRGVP